MAQWTAETKAGLTARKLVGSLVACWVRMSAAMRVVKWADQKALSWAASKADQMAQWKAETMVVL